MLIRFFSSFTLLFLLVSCNPGNNKDHQKKEQDPIDPEAVKKQFMEANKLVVQKENDEMDYYEKSHQMSCVKTNSGIRYYVYEHSAKGDSIKTHDKVLLSYKLSLLDGTPCYSSDKDGKKTIIVGQDDIESGVHKALLYLKRGDKAILLIPSHLAHGLMGDMKKIPPQMPIVYDLEVE